MLNKRGLSQIVTVVLVILIVIVAIVLVWTFAKPFFSESSEKSKVEAELIATGFDIKSESVLVDEEEKTVSFIVQRETGGGDVEGLRVVLEDENGNAQSFIVKGNINELESRNLKVDYSSSTLRNIVKIGVFPIGMTDSNIEVISSIGDSIVKNSDGSFSNGGRVTQSGGGGSSGGDTGSGEEENNIVCGNGLVESGEQCDLNNLNGKSCETQEFSSGTLVCSSECVFDISSCVGNPIEICGNGEEEGTEQCDDSNLVNGDGCSSTCTIEETEESEPVPDPEPPLENVNVVCEDSDSELGNAQAQSLEDGFVSLWYNECESFTDSGTGACDYLVSASDVCKNENILYEQTCGNDDLQTEEVVCANSCSAGKCL
ncbi:hypothetical protein J4408_00345 [Candidatus Pacearchaeota archaeon]|nr:hypothetical protein [Candidatus Pacearchaeota archaeon]